MALRMRPGLPRELLGAGKPDGDLRAGMAIFRLNPRVVEQLRKQMGLFSLWTSTFCVGVVWLTDWRAVLDYVPWINGKFKKDE